MRYKKDAPHPAEPRRVRQGRGLDMCDPFFLLVLALVLCSLSVPRGRSSSSILSVFALLFLDIMCGSLSCSFCDPRGRSSSSILSIFVLLLYFLVCRSWSLFLNFLSVFVLLFLFVVCRSS